MLRGVVDRRIGQRVPFHAELKINFEHNGVELEQAIASNISAGGIEFYIPADNFELKYGDTIEFCFNLPLLGTTLVKGEVRHLRQGVDLFQRPALFCGVKFLDLSLETWNSITQYCSSKTTRNISSSPAPATGNSESTLSSIHKRATLDLDVIIELPEGRTINGKLEDISFGGARICTPESIPVNTYVVVKIGYRDVTMEVNGVSVWNSHCSESESQYLTGIFFHSLDAPQLEQLRTLIKLTSMD
jgi:hypothetical protein